MSSYTMIEKRLREIPEDCLDEIGAFIDFTLYRLEAKEQKNSSKTLADYFGSIKQIGDGMNIQRQMRDEWN